MFEHTRYVVEGHITMNKNAIPSDRGKPLVTSGIRLGTPAMTTREFQEAEAQLIADVLDAPHDASCIAQARERVTNLTNLFPVYR